MKSGAPNRPAYRPLPVPSVTRSLPGKSPALIRTPRLDLVPASPALVKAELQGRVSLEQLLGIPVPTTWPPEFFDAETIAYVLKRLLQGASQAGWWYYYFIRKVAASQTALVVGAGGYQGLPDEKGIVKIGYAVLPEFQGRGFATEAVRGLIGSAFAFEEVRSIAADTYPHLLPSIRVLEKCGFRRQTDQPGTETLRYILTRGDYNPE